VTKLLLAQLRAAPPWLTIREDHGEAA